MRPALNDTVTWYNDNIRPIVLLGGMNGMEKPTFIDEIRFSFIWTNEQGVLAGGNLGYSEFLKIIKKWLG